MLAVYGTMCYPSSLLLHALVIHHIPCHMRSFPALFSLTSAAGLCLADDLLREHVLRFPPIHVILGMFVSSSVIYEIL